MHALVLYAVVSKEVNDMTKNPKQTGKKAASAASKVLRSGSTSKTSKRAAGSALAQAPYKKRK